MSIERAVMQILARHVPGLDLYADILEIQAGQGYGRLKAMQDQVIFQHLLLDRLRIAKASSAVMNEAEDQVTKYVRAAKLKEVSTLLFWLVEYALFRRVILNDQETWKQIKAIL